MRETAWTIKKSLLYHDFHYSDIRSALLLKSLEEIEEILKIFSVIDLSLFGMFYMGMVSEEDVLLVVV